MAASIPPLPPNFKPLQHYLKTAQEHDNKFPIVSYYCRMYALQKGMEIDKTSPEAKAFLLYLMDQLEQMKAALASEEAIKSDTVAQASVEHYALKLFAHADTEDRAGRYNKNVVKSFYNSMLLFEVLTVFGPLNEDIEKYKKYARYKSAYINKCMKSGITPVPGPVDEEGQDLDIGNLAISSYMASRNQVDEGSHQPPTVSQQPPTVSQQPPTVSHQPPAVSQQPPNVPHQPPATVPQQPPIHQQPSSATAGNFQVDWEKATKYSKFATSSLTYEDRESAIDYLQRALNLLVKGHE